MKIYTALSETDEVIDWFDTIEDAIKAIEAYEKEDKKYGDYTPDRYEVMNEDYCVYDISHETIVIQSLENINRYERYLLSSLMFIFALTDETYPNKDSSKNLQELAEYIESYDFLREHLKMRIDETCERIKKWKQACDSDELKRLQKYIEEIQVLKADLQYFDKLYKNQTSSVKTI